MKIMKTQTEIHIEPCYVHVCVYIESILKTPFNSFFPFCMAPSIFSSDIYIKMGENVMVKARNKVDSKMMKESSVVPSLL